MRPPASPAGMRRGAGAEGGINPPGAHVIRAAATTRLPDRSSKQKGPAKGEARIRRAFNSSSKSGAQVNGSPAGVGLDPSATITRLMWGMW